MFDELDITQNDEQRGHLRRTSIGFVFQSVALISTMSAYENVEFALRLSKYTGDRSSRTAECLNLVGLGSRE